MTVRCYSTANGARSGWFCDFVKRRRPANIAGSRYAFVLYFPAKPACPAMKYLPNTITILRILVTPIVLLFLLQGTTAGLVWAWALFILASISDYVDGKLARTLEVRSRLGQFLDPLADKVLVIGTFAVLAYIGADESSRPYPLLVPWWVVIVIVIRDVAVTGLRSWAESHGGSIRTSGAAKAKTVVQLVFLIGTLTILVIDRLPGVLGAVGRWILESDILYGLAVVVALVTAATGLAYFYNVDYSRAQT